VNSDNHTSDEPISVRESGQQIHVVALEDPVGLIPVRPTGARLYALTRTLLRPLGIDRPIAYTLVGRGWNVLAGLANIALIARFLRPEEQGYYYTLASILALYTFCELGLTFVLTQFASHEKAHLEWTEDGSLTGSASAKVRLAALSRQGLQWYCGASMFFLVLVLPAGLYFFSLNSTSGHVSWRTPLVWSVGATVLNLCATPFFAILEGCGKISELALVRTGQNIFSNSAVWIALLLRTGLFAVAVFPTVYFLVGFIWLVSNYRGFFRDLLRTDVTQAHFHWWTEVWPFQWRMAVSSASSYLVSQLFVPVLFAWQGPVAAGQMGMSLSLCNALLNGSMAWITTKTSPFGVLVARRQWKEFDALFFKTFRQSVLILLAGCIALCCALLALHSFEVPISKRFLVATPFAALLLSTVMNHAVFCEAQYLRTHKAEPFLGLSVASAVMTCASTLSLARPFGAAGISYGYLVCCVVSLALGTKIFVSKRRAWHA
jgi:hypothetical protein